MNLKSFVAGLATLALWHEGAIAQNPDALTLAPATPWALDYADDSCRLVRTFGTGENQVTVGLTAYAPGGMFFLSASGELTRVARRVDTVRVALDTVEAYNLRYLQVDFGDTPGILITNGISMGPMPEGGLERLRQGRPVARFSMPEVEDRVRWIGIVDGLEQEFIVQTGSMRAPMQALEDCTLELRSHWDIDHAAHENLAFVAREVAPFSRWLRLSDFPREMRQSMAIHYRLIVDEAGEIADCRIIGVQPDSEVHRIACERIRERANLLPAQNAEGTPVRSYLFSWSDLRE